jgi:hypothetical protein
MVASIVAAIGSLVVALVLWDYEEVTTSYEPIYVDVETRALFTAAENSTVLALDPVNAGIWAEVPGGF